MVPDPIINQLLKDIIKLRKELVENSKDIARIKAHLNSTTRRHSKQLGELESRNNENSLRTQQSNKKSV